MLIRVTVFSTSPFLRQHKFEKLIHHPRNCGRWNLKHDACRCAGKKADKTTEAVNRSCCRDNPVDLFTLLWHGTAFLCVQQRLADIERSRQPCRDGSSNPTRKHVRHWPVLAVVVDKVLRELVDNKVEALIRDVEHQLCAETVVESSPSFPEKNRASAVDARPVWCSVDLQALLNYCNHTSQVSIKQ